MLQTRKTLLISNVGSKIARKIVGKNTTDVKYSLIWAAKRNIRSGRRNKSVHQSTHPYFLFVEDKYTPCSPHRPPSLSSASGRERFSGEKTKLFDFRRAGTRQNLRRRFFAGRRKKETKKHSSAKRRIYFWTWRAK